METLSETQKRNTKIDQDSPKRKVRKGGNTALAFLAEKAEKETKLKEDSNRLETERQEMEKEKTDKFMQQQNDMLTAILEMQRQQNNQVQASQMVLMQQQQQQGQALIALLSRLLIKKIRSAIKLLKACCCGWHVKLFNEFCKKIMENIKYLHCRIL